MIRLLPLAPLAALPLLVAAPAHAQAVACQAGARVAAASYGHWYRATVLRAEGGKCWVHYDKFSSSSDEPVTADNLGPIALADQYDHPAAAGGASSAAAAVAGGGDARAQRLVAAAYTCTGLIGSVQYGGHLVHMPGITILPGGGYRHENGGAGRVTASGGTLEFHGGPLDGQAATYDAGPNGRGNIHLYNASRSRTVIDCDGHG